MKIQVKGVYILNDKEFIKLYKNLKSISNICDELGIDKGNVSRGTISDEQAKKLADELKFEIVKIYSSLLIGRIIDGETNTL